MAKFGMPMIGGRAPVKAPKANPFAAGPSTGNPDRDATGAAAPRVGKKANSRYSAMRKGIRAGTR